MWLSALTWLTGSKAGRITAIALLACASAAIVILRAFSAGKANERLAQSQSSLTNLTNRVANNDAVTKMPRDERRKELERWATE